MADLLIVMKRGAQTVPILASVCEFDGTVNGLPLDGVIDCTLPAHHVATLKTAPGVSYVRQVQAFWSSEPGLQPQEQLADAVEV